MARIAGIDLPKEKNGTMRNWQKSVRISARS